MLRNIAMHPAIERQADVWNQLLEANRSMWSLYAPWTQATPWLWSAFTQSGENNGANGIEQDSLLDGLPDPLEIQARAWNHFLEAHKQFWALFNWPFEVPGASEAANEAAPVYAASSATPINRRKANVRG